MMGEGLSRRRTSAGPPHPSEFADIPAPPSPRTRGEGTNSGTALSFTLSLADSPADDDRRPARRIVGAAPLAAGHLDARLAQRACELRLRRRLVQAGRRRRDRGLPDLGL